MLPDFPLVVTFAGEPYGLLARDVVTAVFFHGFPNTFRGTECYAAASEDEQREHDAALEQWTVNLLERVVIEPRLTSELVQRLGEGAQDASLAYLRTIGWITQRELETQAEKDTPSGAAARRYLQGVAALAPVLLPVSPPPAPATIGEELRPLIAEIQPNVRRAVARVATAAHARPSLLWRTPISEFIFDWRTLVATDAEAAEAAEPVYTNDAKLVGATV